MKALKILSKNSPAKSNGGALVPKTVWEGLWDNPFQALQQWPSAWQNSSFSWPTLPAFKTPAVDVSEDDKEIKVKAEVPGLSEKDLDVTYANGILRLKGEKKGEKEEKQKNTWHRESWHGFFSRDIPVGESVEWGKSDAKYKDGVLTITLPKIPGKENRVRINVQ